MGCRQPYLSLWRWAWDKQGDGEQGPFEPHLCSCPILALLAHSSYPILDLLAASVLKQAAVPVLHVHAKVQEKTPSYPILEFLVHAKVQDKTLAGLVPQIRLH